MFGKLVSCAAESLSFHPIVARDLILSFVSSCLNFESRSSNRSFVVQFIFELRSTLVRFPEARNSHLVFPASMTVPLQDSGQQPTSPLADDLIFAARYGDLEELQAVLAQEILLVDAQDDQGRTALHMAAANGHLVVVQVLIGAGANVNAKNVEENSPLHYAALNAHIPIIQELISKGANAAALNRYERTPLDEAIGRNNAAVVDAINTAAVSQLIETTNINSLE